MMRRAESEKRAKRSAAVRPYGENANRKPAGQAVGVLRAVWGWRLVFALGVLGLAAGARAGLSVQVEPESVAVAQPVTVTIVSDGGAVVWPDWSAALPGWEVVPESVTDTRARLRLRSWLPGDIAVPALTVNTPGGVTFTTEPRTVAVSSVLADDADVADVATLRDNAGAVPRDDPGRGAGVGWAAAGLAVALVLAALWIKRRLRARTRPEALAAAQLDTAAQSGDVGEAVDVVRRYVEARFGHRLRHQTASELALDPGAAAALGAALRDALSELQQRGEALRFAGAAGDDPRQIIALARRVFDQARDTTAVGGPA